MSKKDEFDNFLQTSLRNVDTSIEDDGFTENVISNLPSIKIFSVRRNIILFLAGFISVFIFFISNGYKLILISMTDIFNNVSQLIIPSGISVLILSVFIGVFMYISCVEYNKNTL